MVVVPGIRVRGFGRRRCGSQRSAQERARKARSTAHTSQSGAGCKSNAVRSA
ncbi:MAG: hypothetical protein V5B38_08280 [Candidatus Accumulibacter propinquus]